MLYFEDFMEVFWEQHSLSAIENLPEELNESLNTLQQLDFRIQTNSASLLDVQNTFFEDCKFHRLSEFERNKQYAEIGKQYNQTLLYCKDKRDLMEKIQVMYKKLVRKLDTELEKFRLELEADNSGITEQIEKQRRQRFRYQSTGHFKNPFLMRRRIVEQACRTALKSSIGRPSYPPKIESLHSSGRFSDRGAGIRKQSHAPGLSGQGSASRHKHMDRLGMALKKTDEDGLPVRMRTMDYLGDSEIFDDLTGGDLDTKQLGYFTSGNARSIMDTDEEEEDDDDDDDEDLHADQDAVFPTTPSMNRNSSFFGLTSTTPSHDSSGTSSRILGRYPSIGASFSYHSDVSDSSTGRGPAIETVPSPIGWHCAASELVSTTTGTTRPSTTTSLNKDHRPRAAGFRRTPLTAHSSVPSSSSIVRDALLLDTLIPGGLSGPTGQPGDDVFDNVAIIGTHDGEHELDGFDSGFAASDNGIPGSSGAGVSNAGISDVNVLDTGVERQEEEDEEDQKRYCVCNDVSYGDMIACDNPTCPFEWFHYSCVNLTVAPKGDWYCPNCAKIYMIGQKGVRKRIGRR